MKVQTCKCPCQCSSCVKIYVSMSKKVCVCGAEHGKDPLVITITTCNKNHFASLRNTRGTGKGYGGSAQDGTVDHILTCEEDDVVLPCGCSVIRGDPIETGTLCDLDCELYDKPDGLQSEATSEIALESKTRLAREAKKKEKRKTVGTSPEKVKRKASPGKKSSDTSAGKDKHKSTSTTPIKKAKSTSAASVQSKSSKTKGTSASTSPAQSRKVSPKASAHKMKDSSQSPSLSSEVGAKQVDKSTSDMTVTEILPKKSKKKKEKATSPSPERKRKKEKKQQTPMTSTMNEDETSNFPEKRSDQTSQVLITSEPDLDAGNFDEPAEVGLTADADLMLPVLIPRYHGPGCTMEVNVLEKHDKKCRYKKLNNPERSRIDDRSGSFEVIGRIVFKTCQTEAAGMSMNDASRMKKGYPQNSKLAAIYSLFHIPCDFDKLNEIKVTTSKSDRQIEALKNHLRYKKVLENLIQSAKSFPNDLSSDSCNTDKASCSGSKPDEVFDMDYGTSVASYELEEIYISKKESEKSITLTQPYKNKQKQKKWFYLLFSCLSSDDSYTNVFKSKSDTSYECDNCT